MENNVYYSEEKSLPILKILYKNLLLIIMITVLCALLALGYSVWRVKPTYTASRSVILRTTMNSENSSSAANALSNQAALAKLYIPNVAKLIKSPDVIAKVDDAYENGNERVVKGAVGVIYGEQSLIFTITYTDKNADLAEEKLNILIDTFKYLGEFKDSIQANDAQLIDTQKKCTVVKSTAYTKSTLLGAVGGMVIAVAIVVLAYMLDSTVKDKKELEEITGVNLLSYIDKEKTVKAK